MFWTEHSNHITLTIRLTPNSGLDRIEGPRALADGKAVLAVRVRAIPEDGAANQALCKFLAKAAGVPKSRVSIASGHASRVKTVRIEGDPRRLIACIGVPES